MSSIFNAADFEMVGCPICSGKHFQPLLGEDRYLMGIRTVGCQSCGFVMTNPQPTEQALDRFYKQHYRDFYQKVTTPSIDYIKAYKKDVRSAATAQFLLKHGALHDHSRALDIGAAEGSMLKAIATVCPDATLVAVEPNPDFGAFAQSHAGCHVHSGLDQLKGNAHFDLIVINHVLEHVKKPVEFLRDVAQLLAPEGRLYIDVPSVAEYTGLHDFHVAHLYHFGEESLRNLLLSAGYDVHVLEKHSPVMHPRSLRTLCSVGTSESPRMSPACREGWEACMKSGKGVWKTRLRSTSLWRMLSSLKRFLQQLVRAEAK